MVCNPEIYWKVLIKSPRTQNKIKNRFYGTLRNYVRFMMNFFDGSNKCYNY